MNYRFTDSDFPGGKGKPAWFHKKTKPPQKRRAWFDEYNRRASNGEDDLAESQEHSIQVDVTPDISTLAGEIEAARQEHRQRTGNGVRDAPQDSQNPPCSTAEEVPTDGGQANVKHDEKSDKEAFLRLSKLSRAEYDRVRVRPWATWNRGRGINPSNLAKLLKAYGIKVTHPRIGTFQLNGYRADQFNDAFLRYLQPEGFPGSPKSNSSNEYNVLAWGPLPWNGEAWGTLHQSGNQNKAAI